MLPIHAQEKNMAADNGPARDAVPSQILEKIVQGNDLAKLSATERTEYYLGVCRSLGLNPATSPLAYLQLSGRLVLYALRSCTDQLRTIHGVSVEELTTSTHDDVYTVTCKVRHRDGRTDMATGAVPFARLKGEGLANAIMKAETKSKRRATLSLCGLGFLDESELDTIPPEQARRVASTAPANTPPPASAPTPCLLYTSDAADE